MKLATRPTDRRMQMVLTGCALATGLAWFAMLSLAPMLEQLVCGQAGFDNIAPIDSGSRALFLIVMWCCMMIAMMLPVGALGLLSGGRAPATGRSAFGFLSGYLGVALTIAVGIGMLESALEMWGVLDGSRAVNPVMRGLLLIAAALYPALRHSGKIRSCLADGKAPSPSLSAGLSHGCRSIGCCVAMIAVQFAVGSMSVLWMAALSLWMLLETLSPWREKLAAFSAIGLLTAGGLSLAGALL